MSESLLQINVIDDIIKLATFTGADCSEFNHRIVNSKQTFAGAGPLPIFSLTIAPNSCLIVTGIDVKALINPAAPPGGAGNGDWRSTDDINPFGPFGGGDVGVISITDNGNPLWPDANDIGVINTGILLVFQSGHNIVITADPQQAAGTIVLVSRLNAYSCRQEVGTRLTKSSSRILNATPPATFIVV